MSIIYDPSSLHCCAIKIRCQQASPLEPVNKPASNLQVSRITATFHLFAACKQASNQPSSFKDNRHLSPLLKSPQILICTSHTSPSRGIASLSVEDNCVFFLIVLYWDCAAHYYFISLFVARYTLAAYGLIIEGEWKMESPILKGNNTMDQQFKVRKKKKIIHSRGRLTACKGQIQDH
jgi:hypothetical protein